ncbi:MAG: tRNA (adenosine(37)-N6)-threonylcarbamoyltransferase complex ATPase subunit type 1 TsaE [Candidatus Abyssubacteria bacterium]
MRLLSDSPDKTRKLGESLGACLPTGSVIALVGQLGSGKTVFAQGLATGLGVAPDEYVSSPSFAIVNQYRGRVPIFHVDTYRLHSEPEMVALGYEEYFDPGGVTIIEWADKVRGLLPEQHIIVEFSITGHTTREMHVTLVGAWDPAVASRITHALTQAERNS